MRNLLVVCGVAVLGVSACTGENPAFVGEGGKVVFDDHPSASSDADVRKGSSMPDLFMADWSGGGSCANGILDGDQTDIDCGGACGATCKRGQTCRKGSDCITMLCVNNTCVDTAPPNTCTNEVKDGDETDVDCGGSCLPCYSGDRCVISADCWSRLCVNNVCLGGPKRPIEPLPDGGTPTDQ